MKKQYSLPSWTTLQKYKGEWVATDKTKVLSHGKDAKKVYSNAIKLSKHPCIFQVPEEADEVYLLWYY